MRVVVPFTNLHPVTRQVLDSYRLSVEYVDVSGGDDKYRQLLRRLWSERQTVVVVEHDVIPWPGAIEELSACPCEWGANSYLMHGGIGIAHALGCTKLTARLMERLPSLWNEPGRWDVLDQRLFFAARGVGIEPHLHRPPVVHLASNTAHAPRHD